MNVRTYKTDDQNNVIELWHKVGLLNTNNSPEKDIERKIKHDADHFLVTEENKKIVGTIMFGYEGHRGWINYLCVDPEFRHKGIGTIMVEKAEKILYEIGCPKINIQIRNTNKKAIAFYENIGFKHDHVHSMGKRIIYDNTQKSDHNNIISKIFRIETDPACSEDSEDIKKVKIWSKAAFSHIKQTVQYEAYKGPRHRILTYYKGDLVNYLHVIETFVNVNSRFYRTFGIGGVVTPQEQRRKGFCSIAMHQAIDFGINVLNSEIGFLFSLPETVKFYKKFGWKCVPFNVLVNYKNDKMESPFPAMIFDSENLINKIESIDIGGCLW